MLARGNGWWGCDDFRERCRKPIGYLDPLSSLHDLLAPWLISLFHFHADHSPFNTMLASWHKCTHTSPHGTGLLLCCCKTTGRECEHGLRLAPMTIQVGLMSHCCDYQLAALAQLEAPQVNQRGAGSTHSPCGPQTTLMGFCLLLSHWTFWKIPAFDDLCQLVGATQEPD